MCGHASRSERRDLSAAEFLLYVDVPAFLSTSDCVTSDGVVEASMHLVQDPDRLHDRRIDGTDGGTRLG